MTAVYRARAPLRLSFGGGGTDLPSYSSEYGGAVLNATLNMYAHVAIIPKDNGRIRIRSINFDQIIDLPSTVYLPYDGELDLLKGVYNRIVREFDLDPLSFEILCWVDAPPGSGLGSSSTMVVACIQAFIEWLNLPLGEYDIARMAYEIERIEVKEAGGQQDQFAATFGGFNFMEFEENRTIINPLRIKPSTIAELEFSILLYYTNINRHSAKIIENQETSIANRNSSRMKAMHKVKQCSYQLKEALLKSDLSRFGCLLHEGWIAKKATASLISSSLIDNIYTAARSCGAIGGKISGAGGGGFMLLYCPALTRYDVITKLETFDGEVRRFSFTEQGASSWRHEL